MVVRFDEILKYKLTAAMDNPTMTLIPLPAYQMDRQKVIEISNYIEMLPLNRFVITMTVFIEAFGKPKHPEYIQESKIIEKFQVYSMGEHVPRDLTGWCIRFELNKEEMILKNMKIKTIYLKLMERFPNCYIVYAVQPNATILRVYVREAAFKRGRDVTETVIRDLADELKACVIRGIDGITQANVISIAKTHVAADGSLEKQKIWCIDTNGTNLSQTLENPYLDTYECNTTSIEEIERIYGIEAARNKIVDELLVTEKNAACYEWATVYADEMTYNGRITSIQRSGMGRRELDHVLSRMSFGSPVQVVQQAAINNQTDHLGSMSAPLCLGDVSKFGSTFNNICINHEHVKEMTVSKQTLIDAI